MGNGSAGGDHQNSKIELFLQLDRLGAIGGMLIVVVANGFWVKEPAIYLILPLLIGLVLALSLALYSLRNGRRSVALWLAAAGNWVVALVVSFLLAFLWPVMILTSFMPLVLAMPYLARKQLVPFMFGAAVIATCICTVGLLRDDESVIEDVDDAVEFVAVLGGLLAQAGVLGLLIWQGNQLQRDALGDALQLNQELADSRVRLVEAGDRERSRIERDLHDGAQQRLAAIAVRLRLHGSTLEPGADHQFIDGLIDELGEATTELRELAHGVYPPLLEQRGLVPALTAVARRVGGSIEHDLQDIGRFDRSIESAFYFVCREALANVQKHRPDAAVTLQLLSHDLGGIELRVTDTGPGFDPTVAAEGRGLLNMSDRLAAVGGTLELESTPAGGTSVIASLPVV